MMRLFVSSVQKEFAGERKALGDFLKGDALLRRFFEVFLFEEAPAADHRADQVYLDEVGRCDIYIGLFGNEYGWEDADGMSPSHLEFREATRLGKTRLIFVKGASDQDKHPKMKSLISEAGGQLIRRRFNSPEELKSAVYASLVQILESNGSIQILPFDDRVPVSIHVDDLDEKAIRRFVRRAQRKRQFALSDDAPVRDILEHLNLLNSGEPTNAAVLVFGKKPQKFIPDSEIRCMHFHGTSVQRPAPCYQIFQGTLFELVDQAVDFVLSKIDLSVGTRAESVQVPTAYEVPPDVITEAIVNAVAHRDYSQAGAVQVSVFADRIEVWSPGEMPPPLTLEQLRKPHRSSPRNSRIAEALYLAGYIEKYGTGTLMMIQESIAHALPEPDFKQHPGDFIATIWRDWLTERFVAGLILNERQSKVIPHLKISRRITNSEYRALTGAIVRTATRDLDGMVGKGVLQKSGSGRASAYLLVCKPAVLAADNQDINRTNRTSNNSGNKSCPSENSSEMAQTAHCKGDENP